MGPCVGFSKVGYQPVMLHSAKEGRAVGQVRMMLLASAFASRPSALARSKKSDGSALTDGAQTAISRQSAGTVKAIRFMAGGHWILPVARGGRPPLSRRAAFTISC